MSTTNYEQVVRRLALQYPEEWEAAHRGGPKTEDFVKRLAWELHRIDARAGLNGKRGNPDDLSDDCVCVREPGKSKDVRTGESVAVMDFIISAGTSEARPGWIEVWDPNQFPTKAVWVQPKPVEVTIPPSTPPSGLTREEVQMMINAALVNVPKYGDKMALEASGGKLLCAEGGGPTEDYTEFILTSRSDIGSWESWKLRKGE